MQEIIEYISRFKPGFSKKIEGASEGEIKRLSQLTNMVLPDSYCRYLRSMGRDDGGLDIGRGSTTNIRNIIDYYQETVDFGEEKETFPANCIIIAVSGGGTFELSLEMTEDRILRVLLTSGDEIKGLCSDSFEKLLFKEAFVKYELSSLKFSGIYTCEETTETPADIATVFSELGFEDYWFSDSTSFCGKNKENNCVFAEQILSYKTSICIGANNKMQIEKTGNYLIKRSTAKFTNWYPTTP